MRIDDTIRKYPFLTLVVTAILCLSVNVYFWYYWYTKTSQTESFAFMGALTIAGIVMAVISVKTVWCGYEAITAYCKLRNLRG